MSRELIDQHIERYLAVQFESIEHRLAMEWSEAALDVHRWDLKDSAEVIAGGLANVDYRVALNEARALLGEAEDEQHRKLARRLLEAKLELIKAELRALSGEPLVCPQTLAGASAVLPESPPQVTLKLSEVADLYSAQRVAEGNWRPKTELQNRTIFALLVCLMGDPAMVDITKETIRQVGTDVVNLPSNMTKRFPGLSPQEVLMRLEGDTTTPRLEPRSVNKYRQLLRSLFKWATENEYINSNPAAVLKDVKEPPAREGREDFTDEELRAYFRGLPQSIEDRPFLYWIPRILAYTGMRLGECSQLRKEDFREAMGIPVFDINAEDGKALKNTASRRQVPIHDRLIELGLLQFVEGMPGGFLWPAEMRTTDNPHRGDSDKLSKLLGRHLRKAGVLDEKKTGAHSFRHTVSTRLKDHSVPDYQISDLVGHEDDSMTTGRYGKRTNVARLADVVNMVQLPI